MWTDHPLFARDGSSAIGDSASPAFRLSAYVRYETGHPYLLTDEWEALFAVFRPLVEEHCDRVVMWDRPGANARRGKKILPTDWEPFRHLRSVDDEVETGIFAGFYFLDRGDELTEPGRGPAGFRFFIDPAIRVEACIPVADWTAGKLDMAAMIKALQALPYISLAAGFGLCFSDRYEGGDSGAFLGQLRPLAERYPVLDLGYEAKRNFFPGDMDNFAEIGIAGINWLTGIGEPFRAAAGPELALDLPPGMQADAGPNGTIFQLGEGPITGEAGVDDASLSLYHALGARIARAWAPGPDMPRSPVFGEMLEDESLAWERRFYQPYRG